jgi:hypothetical protein
LGTVIRWHRAGFRSFWRWKSRCSGRPKPPLEIGSHFGVIVSQKLVAQGVPLIGAAGGLIISRRSRAAISRSCGWNASMEWAWSALNMNGC